MTATVGRWCEQIDPSSAAVDCGGQRHVVTWRRGKVVLVDHDLTAEEAAFALGSPPSPCLEVLHVWRNRDAWSAATRPSPPGFARRTARLGVPQALLVARELGVVRAWERAARRWPVGEEREHLYRYLRRKALAPLLAAASAAQQRYRGGRVSFVEVRLHEGNEREILGRVDRGQTALVVGLTPDWLRAVWARGIGEVDGRFVLDVVDATAWPLAASVEVVDWLPPEDAAESGDEVREPKAVAATLELTDAGYRVS